MTQEEQKILDLLKGYTLRGNKRSLNREDALKALKPFVDHPETCSPEIVVEVQRILLELGEVELHKAEMDVEKILNPMVKH